jgi:hypothetical protein
MRATPVVGAIAIAWGASTPGWVDTGLWVGMILLAASVIGGSAHARAVKLIRKRGYPDGGVSQELRRWHRSVRRMIGISALLLTLRPSLYARFWISEPWLAGTAAYIEAQPFSQSTPYVGKLRGLYFIGDTRRCPHGIKLKVTDTSHARDTGPGFFHRSDPGECARFALRWPLGGGWYASW